MGPTDTKQIAKQGQDIYEQRLRKQLEQSHWGAFVAIEPASGDFFLGRTLDEAIGAARKAHPDRVSYALRVGHPVAVEIGCCP